MNAPTDTESITAAIRDLHGCDSTWVESVPVKEAFQGQTVWEGTVQVFDLIGHPTAKRCYAWSHATKGKRRRFVAVLHQGPVDSPEKAVRAAIVQEKRGEEVSQKESIEDAMKRWQEEVRMAQEAWVSAEILRRHGNRTSQEEASKRATELWGRYMRLAYGDDFDWPEGYHPVRP